jgi:hypothetical protein
MMNTEIINIILVSTNVIIAIFAIGTAIYAIKQTRLLRKQIFGEIYDRAQIKDLEFFLPERRKRIVLGFENIQKEKIEIDIGKTMNVKPENEIELHVKFLMGAPQKLRAITWGFADKIDTEEYENHPTITNPKRAFKVIEKQHFERELYMDWHGNWHMEFPFSRFLPKDECFVLCFIVKTSKTGKFPLVFEIRTEEAKNPYKENLWVEVTT